MPDNPKPSGRGAAVAAAVAAVILLLSILAEAKSNAEYLDRVVGRISTEKPFVMYHAARALRHTARVLPAGDLPAVDAAITPAIVAAQAKDIGTEKVLGAPSSETVTRTLEGTV